MHIGLLKELGPKLLKYLLSGIAAAFILIVIVGITTRYYHYNDNSSALIRYGYSLYKEDLIDVVKNSDYADFKVGYNQSEFLDNLDNNKDKIREGLNTNRIRVQLNEDFIRINYKMVN